MAAPIGFGNWQLALDKMLKKLQPTETFQDFSRLKTNEERIQFILNNLDDSLQSVDWLPVYFNSCKKWHGKSLEVAQVWRSKGNRLFQQRKYVEAIAAYTQSLLSAPLQNGNDYVLSLGNRSAALFHQGDYQGCLKDISRAFGHSFPKESQHKLLARSVQAHIQLGQKRDAESSLNKLQEFVSGDNFSLSGDKKETFVKEVKTMEKEIETLSCNPSVGKNLSKPSRSTTEEAPKVYKDNNRILSQATSAVTLHVTQDKGRFIVANQDVEKFSNLIVERPFAAVLLPEHYESHCHHCFSTLPMTQVGCHQCSTVRFCNEECRDTAWSVYHKTECPYMDLFHSVGVAHLSVRIVLTASLQYLQEFLRNPAAHRSSDEIHIKGVNNNGVYDRGYLSVYDLMTHESNTAGEDMLHYSLTAVLLLVTLVHSGFFSNIEGISDWVEKLVTKSGKKRMQHDEKKKPTHTPGDVQKIGGVLLRHILQLVCNAHAITSLETAQTGPFQDASDCVQGVQQVRIATAIYPTASLMNHSCDPTILSSFIGDMLIVRNIKDVKKGDEIFNCYGPHYCRMRKKERQEVLKSQYCFECQCQACLQDDLSSLRFGAFQCPKCSGICRDGLCTECGQPISLQDLKDYSLKAKQMDMLFELASGLLDTGCFKEALEKLEECQNGRQTILYRDHRDLALGEDAIAKCYASLGDFSTSADHLYLSVRFADMIYGDTSVEFAHELQKLAEVLFNAERFAECLDMSSQALCLFESLYSENHSAVKQTRDLKMATQVALMPAVYPT